MKDKPKSFAEEYWQDFEALSFQIVYDKYQLQPHLCGHITKAKNDGGFDGILLYRIDNPCSQHLYRILLEAKLRAAYKHDLPLADFAKTVIIAINTYADKIYITTNAYFSEKTLEQLQRYSQLTGLEIETLNIADITDWLLVNRARVSNVRPYLIDKLFLTATEIDTKKSSRNIQGKLIPIYFPVKKLFGGARRADCEIYSNTLDERPGVVLVEGDYGMGKTIFIEHVFSNLRAAGAQTFFIDLQLTRNARDIFIEILAIAWCMPTHEISLLSETDLNDLTEYLGDQAFPNRERGVLINILRAPEENFEHDFLQNSYFLIQFLHHIIYPIITRTKYAIAFVNVQSGSQQALDFVVLLLKKFTFNSEKTMACKGNISFIIEIETPFLNSLTLNKNDWNRFLFDLEHLPGFINKISLEPWKLDDCLEFIQYKLPNCTIDAMHEIASFFGTVPLFIETGIDLYQKSGLPALLSITRLGFSRKAASKMVILGCIDRCILEHISNLSPLQQELFVLLGLFDGFISYNSLEKIWSLAEISETKEILLDSIYLLFGNNGVQVSHEVYLTAIKKFNYVSQRVLRSVTQKASILISNSMSCDLLKAFRFAVIQGDYSAIKTLWEQTSRYLFSIHEYMLATEILEQTYTAYHENHWELTLDAHQKFILLSSIVHARQQIGQWENQTTKIFLNELEAHLNLHRNGYMGLGKEAYLDLLVQSFELRSSNYLAEGDYQGLLEVSTKAIDILRQRPIEEVKQRLANSWHSKALSYKHLYNLERYVDFMDEGCRLGLCECKTFRISCQTAYASIYTSTSPSKALICFRSIEKDCSDLLTPRLHNNHNIASMLLMLGRYDEVQALASQTWLDAYTHNNRVEEGRSNHLLACLAWIQGDLLLAKQKFFETYELFKNIVHYTHIWPPLINLATVYSELGQPDECEQFSNIALEILLNQHLSNLNNLVDQDNPLEKIYVGLLIVINHLQRIHETYPENNVFDIKSVVEKISFQRLKADVDRYIIPNDLRSLITGTPYLLQGHMLLKI